MVPLKQVTDLVIGAFTKANTKFIQGIKIENISHEIAL